METKKQPNKEKRQPKEEEEEDDDDDDSLKVTTSLDDAAEKILKHSFAIYKICNLDMQSKIQVAYDEAITILDYNDDDHGGGGGDDNTDENEALMLPSTMTQSSPSPRHERLLLKEYQKIHHGHLLGFNVPSPSKRLFRCYCNTPIENYQQKAENLKEKGEVKGEDDYFHHQQPWPSKSFQVASENLGNVLHHILMKCYQHILKKVLTEEEEDNNNINNNDDDDDDDDDTNCSKAVLEKKAENDDGHHGRGDNKEHHPDRLVDEPSSKRLKRRRKGVATEEETEKKEGDEEEGAEWQMEKNWKRQSVRLQQTPLQSVTPAAAEINISNNCPLDYFFYHNNNNNTNADYPNCTIHTDRGLLICVCLSNTVPGLEVRSLTNKQFYCPEDQQFLLMMRNEVRSRREGDDEMNTSNNNNNNNSNKSNHPMSNGWICIMAGDQLSSQLQKKSSSPSPSMNTTNNNNNNTNINSRSISCIHRVRDNLIGPRLSISYELRDTSG